MWEGKFPRTLGRQTVLMVSEILPCNLLCACHRAAEMLQLGNLIHVLGEFRSVGWDVLYCGTVCRAESHIEIRHAEVSQKHEPFLIHSLLSWALCGRYCNFLVHIQRIGLAVLFVFCSWTWPSKMFKITSTIIITCYSYRYDTDDKRNDEAYLGMM